MKNDADEKWAARFLGAITLDTATCSAEVDLAAAGMPHGPRITVFIDEDHTPSVRVPLRHGGGHAITTVDALGRLLCNGIAPDWFVKRAEDGTPGEVHGYHGDGKPVGMVTVARAIAGPISPSAVVAYVDGDPLNLRPSNLVIRANGQETPVVGRVLAH